MLHLRKARRPRTLPSNVVELLRRLGLLHRRRCRGAGSARRATRAIPVVVQPRRRQPRQSAVARISVLSRPPTVRLPTTASSSALRYDVTSGNVPPSLYVFCAAAITKPHAVEHLMADVMGHKVDFAVITETHLKRKETRRQPFRHGRFCAVSP